MPRRMKDLLAKRAQENFVGRTEEMASLLQCLEGECPLVVHIHGIGGVGKSALVHAFSSQAQEQGASVVILDSPLMEPTERGFLLELGNAIGIETRSMDEIINGLERPSARVFLVIETYEVFRLMDTWLRQIFVPALPENVRVILVGREPPTPGWLTAPEWQGLFSSIALGPLNSRDALGLLSRAGVSDKNSQRINRFAKGHPLTLKLAASAALERPSLRSTRLFRSFPDSSLSMLPIPRHGRPSRRHLLLDGLPNRFSERCSPMLPLKRHTIS